ncbi:MAG TPA: sodium:solute symporter family protein [Candidatus Krumholzibacteria bacterium]|nr:sodium:solute symporter family protein [Candidatus Krumholzibacteria bacterium]
MTLWIVFAAYFVALLVLGEVFGRLKIESLDDYLLSGREHGVAVTSASLIATVIGAGSTLGSAAVAYYVGVSAGWYLFSAGPGLLLLAYTIAPRMRDLSVYTVPGYVQHRYGRRAGLVSAVLGLLAIVLFLSAQFYAMGSLVAELTALDLRPAIGLSALVVMTYTLRGGNWAVHWSDTVQVVLIVAGVAVTVGFLWSRVGGAGAFADPPSAAGFEEIGRRWFHPISKNPVDGFDPVALGNMVTAWVVMSTTWHFAMQSTAQRILSSRDSGVVRRSCVIAAIATLPLGVLFALTGMGARMLLPDLPAPGTMEVLEQVRALPALVAELLAPGWAGLVIAALVAVLMSTCDSALLGATTLVSKDLGPRLRGGGEETERTSTEEVEHSRRWTGGIGLLGLAGALVAPGLVQTLEVVAGIYTVALFGPLVAGHVWKRASGAGALSSMAASGVTALVWRITPLESTTGVHMLNVTLPVALIALVVGSWIVPRRDPETAG